MILSCQNLYKAFIVNELLQNVNFIINKGEKVALIGINGAGKTTLFRIITGELLPDKGKIHISSGTTIGYLKQNSVAAANLSIYDYVYNSNKDLLFLQNQLDSLEDEIHLYTGGKEQLLALNDRYHNLREEFEHLDGYQYTSMVKGVLNGLGFIPEDYSKNISTLSGGQKTRVALARELINKPDILMLDEPTNHLDIDSITWLENFLQGYKGTLLIISHDRFFLEQITNKTIEIELGKAQVYQGSYSEYIRKKEHFKMVQIKHYEEQQKTIKQQEDIITKLKSFNREKSIKRAESREKMLNKVTRLERPISVQNNMHLNLKPRLESGYDVLNITELKKSFDSLTLFENLSFDIKKGEHVSLIGNNGTGKSTIFKIINKLIESDDGKIKLGAQVKIGYYDQEHQLLNANNTLLEEISDAYPTLPQGEIRNILASYLFQGDDVYKRVSTLSGGEKGRLTLVKLMLSEANFLILDEPTNHLDLVSKNILENALIGYKGTLLIISHDRYFVNQISTKILYLHSKKIQTYLGNYDDFTRERLKEKQVQLSTDSSKVITQTKTSWIAVKAEKSQKRKLENEYKDIENLIHSTENKLEELESQLCDEAIYTNHIKANAIILEKENLNEVLDKLYEKWTHISEDLEASKLDLY